MREQSLINTAETDSKDVFVILQLDHAQLMHISNQVYYNRGAKAMTEKDDFPHEKQPL